MPSRMTHRRVRMGGRDPNETGRSATPLELLFDLTFVIAFGRAADEFAHVLTEGHLGAAVGGFCFATFAVSWAWINFTWFASAYDTDDWLFRLTTMIQMVGVLILTLGLAPMFDSLVVGEHVDNKVMVLGYVVMRVPMVVQWTRAALADQRRRHSVKIFIGTLLLAQLGWVVLAVTDRSIGATAALMVPLVLLELIGPVVAERVHDGTPWHPHHIAERYGLMVIIALGEGLLGTTLALSALIDTSGWTTDTALLGLAGTSLTFGLWWCYFVVPSGELLHARRERSIAWGYGHIVLFGAVVGTGGGLHAAANLLDLHSDLSLVATVVAVAVPVAVYVMAFYVLYALLTRTMDPFHLLLIGGSAAVIALALLLAAAGVPLAWCLLMLSFTPWVTVVGYELVGHRHNEQVLASL
jgi:low temperature requirement protein LtrA